MSIQPVNLFNFGEGNLKFMINIPASISFKIGIIDAWGNQQYVDFPAHQTTYGLVRNGNWGQATIPVADIRGELIDLRMLSYEFVILEVNGGSCEFALDDIYWEGGLTGIEDASSLTTEQIIIQNIYPNPFSTKTNISYSLRKSDKVELVMQDITGRTVATLVNKHQRDGTYKVNWNAENELPGMYFFKMKTGGTVEVRKCMLLR